MGDLNRIGTASITLETDVGRRESVQVETSSDGLGYVHQTRGGQQVDVGEWGEVTINGRTYYQQSGSTYRELPPWG